MLSLVLGGRLALFSPQLVTHIFKVSSLIPLEHQRGLKKLSRNVAKPGKGRVAVYQRTRASKNGISLRRRQEISLQPSKHGRIIKPTTLDMGDFDKLQGVPIDERVTHRSLLEKIKTFNQLRIHPKVRETTLNNLNTDHLINGPTHIQTLAVKLLRSPKRRVEGPKSWLFAAETGSGKTLAYLLPVLSDAMDRHETEAKRVSHLKEEGQIAKPIFKGIGAVVLVPTLELLAQVSAVVNQILPEELKAVSVGGDSQTSDALRAIGKGVDILVTTPDKLLRLCSQKEVLLGRALAETHSVIVDEADSLMNESFIDSTEKVLKNCPSVQDTIFVTATIPKFFEKILRDKYPETNRLITPSLHRIPRHIDFRVIEAFRPPYSNRKELALQQVLYSIHSDSTEPNVIKRVVVFVNRKETVPHLVEMLKSNNYDAEGILGSNTLEERRELLDAFLKPAAYRKDDARKLKVLVATDLVARGVDMRRVKNIVLYDLPWSAADLLHRAGRTGRLNSKGRVILIITSKDNKGWIKGLERVIKKGEALA